jgi:hypothetical protein
LVPGEHTSGARAGCAYFSLDRLEDRSNETKGQEPMAFNLSKTLARAAATGLVLGAMTACGGSAPAAEAPTAEAPATPTEAAAAPAAEAPAEAAAAPEAKACCKGKNECKGKGGCKTETNGCASKNECKGKGGCNHHCPK